MTTTNSCNNGDNNNDDNSSAHTVRNAEIEDLAAHAADGAVEVERAEDAVHAGARVVDKDNVGGVGANVRGDARARLVEQRIQLKAKPARERRRSERKKKVSK